MKRNTKTKTKTEVQHGMSSLKLSSEQIVRLMGIGFDLKLSGEQEAKAGGAGHREKTFDAFFIRLTKFREDHGHYCVLKEDESKYYSLQAWCRCIRKALKKFDEDGKPSKHLSKENGTRLKDAGFNWENMYTRPPIKKKK